MTHLESIFKKLIHHIFHVLSCVFHLDCVVWFIVYGLLSHKLLFLFYFCCSLNFWRVCILMENEYRPHICLVSDLAMTFILKQILFWVRIYLRFQGLIWLTMQLRKTLNLRFSCLISWSRRDYMSIPCHLVVVVVVLKDIEK